MSLYMRSHKSAKEKPSERGEDERGTPSVAEETDDDLQGRYELRTRQLDEALEQQAASSEVLRVIANSAGDLNEIFRCILENSTRLCRAKFGVLFRAEGEALRAVAFHDVPPAYAKERSQNPVIFPDPRTTLGRAVATKQPAQIADLQSEAEYSAALQASTGIGWREPPGLTGAALAKLADARSVLAVPMVKESNLI